MLHHHHDDHQHQHLVERRNEGEADVSAVVGVCEDVFGGFSCCCSVGVGFDAIAVADVVVGSDIDAVALACV